MTATAYNPHIAVLENAIAEMLVAASKLKPEPKRKERKPKRK